MIYKKSKSLLEEALKYVAGGVNGRLGTFNHYASGDTPLYIKNAKGSKIFDVDGNEFIDYQAALGAIVLGYSHDSVNQAVKDQIDKVSVTGMNSELETEVAKKIINDVPCAEQVIFSNTGTEATSMCLRIARAHSGKNKIIKFEGVYHGWADWGRVDISNEALALGGLSGGGSRLSPIKTIMEAGIPESVMNDLIIVPWNDPHTFEEVVKRHHHEIAGVLVEPIGPYGLILPKENYLQTIKEICSKYGLILIFDEVKSGFRVSLGGGMEYFGVTPDLAAFGKAVANGFPIALIAGNKDVMQTVAKNQVFHISTFAGNPVSLAASKATLNELEKPNTYIHLYTKMKKLASGINDLISDQNVDAVLFGTGKNLSKPGPMFGIFFTKNENINDMRELRLEMNEHNNLRTESFQNALLKRGVHLRTTLGPQFVLSDHTNEDLDKTLEAIDYAFKYVSSIHTG